MTTLTQETPETARGAAAISVVIPVADRAAMLDRALRSIESQYLRPREIIVVDDASRDDTPTVARRHGVRLIELPTRGGSGPARNAGIATASQPWVAFLDSDDEWLPHHTLSLLETAQRSRRPPLLVTAPSVTSEGRIMGNSRPWTVRLTARRLLVPGNVIATSGTMVRTDLLTAVGGFRELPRAQDLDLWLRVLARGPGLALGRPSVRYDLHPGQVSHDRQLVRECFDAILDSYRDEPWLDGLTLRQAYTRVHWDELRASVRARDWGRARQLSRELAGGPIHWGPLAGLWLERRLSRRRPIEAREAFRGE